MVLRYVLPPPTALFAGLDLVLYMCSVGKQMIKPIYVTGLNRMPYSYADIFHYIVSNT